MYAIFFESSGLERLRNTIMLGVDVCYQSSGSWMLEYIRCHIGRKRVMRITGSCFIVILAHKVWQLTDQLVTFALDS